jgi:hypothetical protein
VNGKNQHLGSFKDEDDAARAWNKAALKHMGEDAVLNVLDPDLVHAARVRQSRAHHPPGQQISSQVVVMIIIITIISYSDGDGG